MNYIYCTRFAVNLRYYGSVCEFVHVCEVFLINNKNYYLEILNFKNFIIRNNRENYESNVCIFYLNRIGTIEKMDGRMDGQTDRQTEDLRSTWR